MKFFKKNIWVLAVSVGAAFFLTVSDVSAATVFDTANLKAGQAFQAVKTVIFIVGGFGLVALAFFAVFGKLKWTWFASLAVGLAILAAAGAIIQYATSNDGTGGVKGMYFNDTLTGTGNDSSF